MVSHREQFRQKWVYETSARFSGCCLSEKTVSTASQANKLQNPLLQDNTRDGILLQALRGGTRLNGIGSELIRIFLSDLFCYGWFRSFSRWRSTETDGVCRQIHTSHVILLMQFAQFISCKSHCMAQVSVCARHSTFMSSMMSVWSFVPCCFLVLSFSVSLRRLPLLFYTLPALWPALLLPCAQRRGKHLLRLRLTTSIAPCRFSIIRQKLITDQTEITGPTTIDWKQIMWSETTLLTDRAVQLATAKTYVFSSSMLCLGSISNEPVNALETRMKWFLEKTSSQRCASDRRGTDGVRVEKFPRIHYIVNSREIQKMMTESKREPEQFKGSSSCQCTMTLIGENEGTKNIVLRLLSELLRMHEDSRKDIGRFWSLDPRRNGTEPTSTNWMEKRVKLLKADEQFCRMRTSCISCQQRLGKRRIESKGKIVKSIHFFGSDETIELISSVSTVQ